jgi:hypothetical protein
MPFSKFEKISMSAPARRVTRRSLRPATLADQVGRRLDDDHGPLSEQRLAPSRRFVGQYGRASLAKPFNRFQLQNLTRNRELRRFELYYKIYLSYK